MDSLIIWVVLLVIGIRALAGLALNLRAMLPLPVAALAFVLALASGAIHASSPSAFL